MELRLACKGPASVVLLDRNCRDEGCASWRSAGARTNVGGGASTEVRLEEEGRSETAGHEAGAKRVVSDGGYCTN